MNRVPGTPRKLSDAEVERVLTMTLETTPKDATHWSTRAMRTEPQHGEPDLAGLLPEAAWRVPPPAPQREIPQVSRHSRSGHTSGDDFPDFDLQGGLSDFGLRSFDSLTAQIHAWVDHAKLAA